MTLDHLMMQAVAPPPLSLVLEIDRQADEPPFLIPVTLQNLSLGVVSLIVANPWIIPDWAVYHGQDCILHLEGPENAKIDQIQGRITWSKFVGDSRPQFSLGLLLRKPSDATIKRLDDLITHTTKDLKGLWEKYDQVKEVPDNTHLIQHLYRAGIVCLVGGVALQLTGRPPFISFGWALWALGSLGVAAKIMWSIRQRRAAS
ncbi:MAG: hypothetical protein M0P73_13585 [Syntrophobacterales bacterium]|jgi:hypothetical protein|nr:hypothetical protein [Syntrophobacterales bacterium]